MKKTKAQARLNRLLKDRQFAAGHKVRTQVMGPKIVERDMRVRLSDDFHTPVWELGIRTAWGMLWTRPGLSRRDRSLLNIGIMVALQTRHEFQVHIRAAVHNGLTEEDIGDARDLRRGYHSQSGFCRGAPAAFDFLRKTS